MATDKKELIINIEALLKKNYGGTLATLRPDGTPQASGVGFVNEGLILYIAMDPRSQKKINIDKNPNVGFATFKDYYKWDRVKAVQLAGKCEVVTDQAEIDKISMLFAEKFPWVVESKMVLDWYAAQGPIPYYKLTPHTVAYLDYQKYGFNGFEVLEM
jgi:general stress protein 26